MSKLRRRDHRIILHFDYDCFYAAVFEKENPALKSLPFAVQQKQIIVTCNYEARRRGLYKLQLVREARQNCPDVIIALGEDLNRFRDASKQNYDFLRAQIWSNKAERLGFDEVFLDATDMIDYNFELLNIRDLQHSFFHLDRSDPTIGFSYDASVVSGHTYPVSGAEHEDGLPILMKNDLKLVLRLQLGSHLAQYLRRKLDNDQGFTSTVGISTSKLLSKLVGNVNKPRGQTTLLPPYELDAVGTDNVQEFIDIHDIGKIPGIGFKTAQKLRTFHLKRPASFDAGLVYGGTREKVTVKDIRLDHRIGPEILPKVLNGPGMPRDMSEKVWELIHGVDDADVGTARDVPQQISIEDSYIKLNDLLAVEKELLMLSQSLISRMRVDLTASDQMLDGDGANADGDDDDHEMSANSSILSVRWLAHPKVLRLSTRPRPPVNPDGRRQRSFARISRSGPMPSFIFNLTEEVDTLSRRLVDEAIMPLFRKLHPENSGWDLSLVNLCASSMVMGASDSKTGEGRDIARMFQNQESTLMPWRIAEPVTRSVRQHSRDAGGMAETDPSVIDDKQCMDFAQVGGSEDVIVPSQASGCGGDDDEDVEEETMQINGEICSTCGAKMPAFAIAAHDRFHDNQP